MLSKFKLENPSVEAEKQLLDFVKLNQQENKVMGHLPKDKDTPDAWIKRHPDLIRLTGIHPFNAEAPLSKLVNCGVHTPTGLHYVRNHGPVPKLDWNTHKLSIGGLVENPKEFSMDELVQSFKSYTLPVSFHCAGNRRKELNMIKRSTGFNWGPSAVSCAIWTGIRLCDLLKLVMPNESKSKYVVFKGCDDLPRGHYGTSITYEQAMDPNNDILIAYEMNGEKLHPDHGFPIRVLIPGFIGGRMVKWLKEIELAEQESDSFYHYNDNRVYPPHIDTSNLQSSKYYKHPDTVLYASNVNSAIAYPEHNEQWVINDNENENKTYIVSGYAYSGGGKPIIRVEISLDDGKTWTQSEFKFPENSLRHGAKRYTWCHYKCELKVQDILKAKEIVVRAWDNTFNTQQQYPTWNYSAMMNNCWYRVKLNHEVNKSYQKIVRFIHPTILVGSPPGWMPPPNARAKTSKLVSKL